MLIIFSLRPKFIFKINFHLFMVMLFVILIGIICLVVSSPINGFPTNMDGLFNAKSWSIVLPVAFTSFGFQGSLHSLTKFVENDRRLIQRACLFGSIIPFFIYILWVGCVLTIIFNTDIMSFNKMITFPIEVSELILILSNVTSISGIQYTVWIVSFLTIFTSIIGVGVSLSDLLKQDLTIKIANIKLRSICSVILMLVPATIIAIIIPNAFIKVLSFAGIILAMIALILPAFLLTRMLSKLPLIDVFKVTIMWIVGIIIIMFGILDAISAL